MQSIASGKNLRTSARKLRQVADEVRGKKVDSVLGYLHGLKKVKKGAMMMDKVLRSAIANLQSKNENQVVKTEGLFVKTVTVDAGPKLKRIRARAQGRAFRIDKKTSHLTVVVSD